MKKTIQIIALATLCLFLSTQARAQTAALRTGDMVPDVTFSNVINYQSASLKLSDFKGRLLILDFWATWCGSCIKAMPKLDSLQAEFDDRIQVISVTSQDKKTIDAFKLKNPTVRNFKIPMVTGDKELAALFPYKMVPHLVWISPEGRLIATTSGYDAGSKNIKDLLAGNLPQFKALKRDDLTFDPGKPLFLDGNGKAPDYLYRSLITGYADGLPARSGRSTNQGNFRIYATNVLLSSLYTIALGLQPHLWKDKRVMYEGPAARYRVTNYTEQKDNAVFCYEIQVPSSKSGEARLLMLDDLNRYFGLQAQVTSRNVDCWALVCTNTSLLKKSTDDAKKTNFSTPASEPKYMYNRPLSYFTAYLNGLTGIPQVIDETGYSENMDLELKANLDDLNALNAALAKYGLILKPVQRKIDMLVINSMIK